LRIPGMARQGKVRGDVLMRSFSPAVLDRKGERS
jgi:hypothetical protein